MGLLRLPARADRLVAVSPTKSHHKGVALLGRFALLGFALSASHSRLRMRHFALSASHSRLCTTLFALVASRLCTTSPFATTCNNLPLCITG